MLMRGVVCEHVCERLSRRVYACACVGAGLWVLASKQILSFSQKRERKVCYNLPLWLLLAHNSCGLSLSVVSSAGWNIEATC